MRGLLPLHSDGSVPDLPEHSCYPGRPAHMLAKAAQALRMEPAPLLRRQA